jgi:hypothetical protein
MDVHVPAAITLGLRRGEVDVFTAQTDNAGRVSDDVLLERANRVAVYTGKITQIKEFTPAMTAAWDWQNTLRTTLVRL